MTDEHSIWPWVHVPETTAARMDALAMQCAALATAWGATARRLGVPAGPDAPISHDERFVAERHSHAPAGIGQIAGRWASRYVDAMAQHLQAVEALLGSRRVTLSLWPIVRAELEIAGRVAWFLEPGTAEAPISGSRRVARALMDGLASFCRGRYTAGRMRDQRRADELKAGRERLRTDITSMFPDARTRWTGLGDEKAWEVGGEAYRDVAEGADRFSRTWLGDARGMYDTLSDLSHPSLLALSEQTKQVGLGDRIEAIYVVGPEAIEWQAQLACLTLYRSAHLVAAYFDLSADDLEAWADDCSATHPKWFEPNAAP